MHPLYFTLAFICLSNAFHALTITPTGNGNWNSTTPNAPWPGGIVPSISDDVVISGGFTVTINGAYSCNSLIVGASANQENTLVLTASGNLTVLGTLTIQAPNTNGKSTTVNVGDGTLTCSAISGAAAGGAKIGQLLVGNGMVSVSGNVSLGTTAAASLITVSGNGIIEVGGSFTCGTFSYGTGTLRFNGSGAQTISTTNVTNFYHLTCSTSGTKSLSENIIVYGNLTIDGAASLDVSTANKSIELKGNWTNTSTASDAFVERAGNVIFSGSSLQTISAGSSLNETFHELNFANTSGLRPAIKTSNNILVTNDFNHTAGYVDVVGNTLTINAANTSTETITFVNAGLYSSSGAGSLQITDAHTRATIYFGNYTVGSTTNALPVSLTAARSTWENSTFYGPTTFVKTGSISDDFGGGNTFFGPCSFTTQSGASRWRMGDNTSLGDTYYNATFTANGNNNYIVSANSTNNHFYGTTTLNSTTSGGLYVGRSNGSGNPSATFHGPVVINVQLSGNVIIGDATNGHPADVTFENTVQLNSASSSTGDIYLGNSAASTLTLTATAQLIGGTISGRTAVYLRNLTQIGTLSQTITGSGNSRIYCGYNAATYIPCTFNGLVVFSADTVNVTRSTFNNNTQITANQSLTFSYNQFTGNNHVLQKNGTANNGCPGGNVFAAGTNTLIQNNGSGYLNLANSNADTYYGNIRYVQTGTGTLQPMNGSDCSFYGDISTVGSATAITIGKAGTTATITGSNAQHIRGDVSNPPTFSNVLMNKASNHLTLLVPTQISTNLTLTQGHILTSATNLLIFPTQSVSTNLGSASSFVYGPMSITLAGTGSPTLKFPIGKAYDWRPLLLKAKHTTTTAYTYTVEVFNASARALGYTIGSPSIDTVSDKHFWTVDRSNGNTDLGNSYATLYYGSTANHDYVMDAPNLRAAKTINTGTVWYDIGGSGSSNLDGYITSTIPFNSVGKFTLADRVGGNNSLPVEYITWDAAVCGSANCLSWSLASEKNTVHFEIEKASDGQTFYPFAQLVAAGNSSTTTHYQTTDYNPSNVSYYRIKQVDLNGTYSYSAVKSVNRAGVNAVQIFPNPINRPEKLNLTGLKCEKGITPSLKVIDVWGKTIYQMSFTTADSFQTIPLPENLRSGIYTMLVENGMQVETFKLLVY